MFRVVKSYSCYGWFYPWCMCLVAAISAGAPAANGASELSGTVTAAYPLSPSFVLMHHQSFGSLPIIIAAGPAASSDESNDSDRKSNAWEYFKIGGRTISVSESFVLMQITSTQDAIGSAMFHENVWSKQYFVKTMLVADFSGTVKADGTPSNPLPSLSKIMSVRGLEGKIHSIFRRRGLVFVLHESGEGAVTLHSFQLPGREMKPDGALDRPFKSTMIKDAHGSAERLASASLDMVDEKLVLRLFRSSTTVGEAGRVEMWQVTEGGGVVEIADEGDGEGGSLEDEE